uniref:Uncharacterized protein n=1 Tax=Ditylenchus dipsaci TaxID=166011 RepID=A0A915D5M5_9BILA
PVEELRDILGDLLPGLPQQGNIEMTIVENYAILNQELIKIVSKLREHGIKVAIVTNNGYWTRKEENCTLTDTSPFDLVLESCKWACEKPNPDIFQLAAEKLGVCPISAFL